MLPFCVQTILPSVTMGKTCRGVKDSGGAAAQDARGRELQQRERKNARTLLGSWEVNTRTSYKYTVVSRPSRAAGGERWLQTALGTGLSVTSGKGPEGVWVPVGISGAWVWRLLHAICHLRPALAGAGGLAYLPRPRSWSSGACQPALSLWCGVPRAESHPGGRRALPGHCRMGEMPTTNSAPQTRHTGAPA